MLADLGADVVKVEDPQGGDWLRSLPPLAGEQSDAFHALNRNKRSLALDLRRPEGAAAFLRLAARRRRGGRVVPPGRDGPARGRLRGAPRREPAHRALLHHAATGRTGRTRQRAGHDLDYVALAGVLAANGPPERPLPLGVQVADVAGGAWPAVAGILAALLRARAGGEGAHVDVSMTEGALAMLAMPLGVALGARGAARPRRRSC